MQGPDDIKPPPAATPDGSYQEVKYQATLRMAAFLGETPAERKTIYDEMGKSYKLRSTIVNGGKRRENLLDLTDKTRLYLRHAILNILESDEEFKADEIELALLE